MVLGAVTTPSNTEFDVTVTVPESVLVEIEDGSGSVDVRSVAVIHGITRELVVLKVIVDICTMLDLVSPEHDALVRS